MAANKEKTIKKYKNDLKKINKKVPVGSIILLCFGLIIAIPSFFLFGIGVGYYLLPFGVLLFLLGLFYLVAFIITKLSKKKIVKIINEQLDDLNGKGVYPTKDNQINKTEQSNKLENFRG